MTDGPITLIRFSTPPISSCRLKAFDAHVTVVRVRAAPPDNGAGAAAQQQHIDEYGAGIGDLHRLLPTADIVVGACHRSCRGCTVCWRFCS